MNVLLAKVSCDTPFFRLRLIKPQKPLEHGKPKPLKRLRGRYCIGFLGTQKRVENLPKAQFPLSKKIK
jgi:hypothetical protein